MNPQPRKMTREETQLVMTRRAENRVPNAPIVDMLLGHIAAIEKELEGMRAVVEMVRSRWTFDNQQQPTHNWHDWADCKVALDAALAARKE